MSDIITDLYKKIADHRAAYGPPMTEIRLTQAELDEIRLTVPVETDPSPYAIFIGLPVVIVDKVEDSTLFTMTWESLVRRLGGRP